jgi:hypothetical protein
MGGKQAALSLLMLYAMNNDWQVCELSWCFHGQYSRFAGEHRHGETWQRLANSAHFATIEFEAQMKNG